MDGQMDGHTDVQRVTIMSRHNRVAVYKNDINIFVKNFGLSRAKTKTKTFCIGALT